jgi:ATPase subunit of ABC transporter with duplicated ATPase domains
VKPCIDGYIDFRQTTFSSGHRPNEKTYGAGKTTLLRMLAGDLQPGEGTVSTSGAVGVMRQFIGGPQAGGTTVRDLLLSVSPPRVQTAAAALDNAELAMMDSDDERTQMRYANALNDYAEAGGYDQEVHWDECCGDDPPVR